VLAGDIANGAEPFRLFADWPSHPKRIPIIYVCGNHELYGHPIDPMINKMREGAALNNIHFLENDRVEIGGVRFLGTTLWTDYRLTGLNRTQRQLMEYVELRLNDHQLIRTGRHRFTTRDAFARHESARAWLETELAKPFAGKTVVVTHHGPHPLSIHPRYIGNQLNAGFISDLSDLMPGVDLWLHGHVHDSFDYQVGRCRVVANPAGYIRNRWATDPEFENDRFDKNLLLELQT
jgi:Icc-related predicted phosphoesterase